MSEVKPGSVKHREAVAIKYGLDVQEVIDLPKGKFEGLCMGLRIGEEYGAKKIMQKLAEYQEAENAKANNN